MFELSGAPCAGRTRAVCVRVPLAGAGPAGCGRRPPRANNAYFCLDALATRPFADLT